MEITERYFVSSTVSELPFMGICLEDKYPPPKWTIYF